LFRHMEVSVCKGTNNARALLFGDIHNRSQPRLGHHLKKPPGL
jgi:hypothetical protein